jgi:hypothetical protein
VKFEMTGATKPAHVERLGVVIMVLLRCVAAFLAKMWDKQSASLVNVCVGAAVSGTTLRLGQETMWRAIFPRVLISAISTPRMAVWQTWFHTALTAKRFSHQ